MVGISRGNVTALVALGALALTAVVMLSTGDAHPGVATVFLLAAGVVAAVGCTIRARGSTGPRRRAWSLLAVAATTAAAGNGVVAVLVGGSLGGPAVDATVGIALLIAIVGILLFPQEKLSRVEATTRILDGVVGGCAALIIASALVYSQLLASTEGGGLDRAVVLVIPVLDVIVVTAAASQLLRADEVDRPALALLMVGFFGYAIGDLHYAVLDAEGSYVFGTWTDLGWILGYLMIAVATAVPGRGGRPGRRQRPGGIASTGAVFAIILFAGVIQIVAGVPRDVRTGTGLLWLLLVVAAAARQMLLISENHSLRRGLERTVDAQTADLRHLLRERSALIDSVGDGIYAVDRGGRITLMNRSAREMLGLDGDLDRTTHAHTLFHTDLEGAEDPLAACYITEAVQLGRTTASEDDVYVRGDGVRLEVEITASPILEDDGSVSGAVVAFRDATQRREVERMKRQFLSVVGHELRTPLTAIQGSLQMLDDGVAGPLPAPGPRLLRMATENSERLGRLVNDILDVERLSSGQMPMQIVPHRVDALIADALGAVDALADARCIRISSAADDSVVVADEGRFGQVITNLVGNALKFSEPGTEVRVTADATGDDVVVGVHDQGRGIPEAQIEAVFERFRQVDSSDVRREGGMGLGLAITREIVHQMNGRIWVTSEVGVGTTFWFTLPRAVGTGVGGHDAAPAAPGMSTEE